MTAAELLAHIKAAGGSIAIVDGYRLAAKAPDGVLTPDAVGDIRRHKERILRLLRPLLPCHDEHFLTKHWLDEEPVRGRIRTACKHCGRFIGYRPTEGAKHEVEDQGAEAEGETETQPEFDFETLP